MAKLRSEANPALWLVSVASSLPENEALSEAELNLLKSDAEAKDAAFKERLAFFLEHEKESDTIYI